MRDGIEDGCCLWGVLGEVRWGGRLGGELRWGRW